MLFHSCGGAFFIFVLNSSRKVFIIKEEIAERLQEGQL